MAQEEILNVSLKDYKKKIDELRASLLNLDSTSQEYQKTAEEIRNRQAKLNEVMGIGKKDVNAVAGSYNALSQEMSRLKKEWKDMEIGTDEWKKTAAQINDLNDKLKNADSEVGVYSRNVGNYTQSFVDAFAKMGNSAKSLNNPLNIAKTGVKSFGTALKTLAANPIGAIIMAVVVVVKALVSAFKRNEEATASLKKAMAPLQAVLTLVQKGFDFLATSIGKAAEAAGNFFGKLFGSDSEVAKINKDLQDIADNELKLAKQQRETIVQNADAEREVAELRNKAAQKSEYTEEERLQFLEQAGEKEKEIAKRAYEDLKLQYEIIKKKNSLTESTAEEKQAEAEAYAAMVQAETAYFNKTKEIASQISEIRNKDLEKVKEVLKKIKESSMTEKQILTQKYYEEKRLLEKYHKDTTELTTQYNKKLREIEDKAMLESYNKSMEYYNRLKALEKPSVQLEMDYDELRDKLDEFSDVMNKGWNLDFTDNKKITKEMKDALDSLKIYGIKTEEDLIVAYKELKKQFIEVESEIKKNDFERWAKEKESNLMDIAEGSAAYYKNLYSYYKEYLGKMTHYPNEEDIDFQIRQKNIKKAASEALKSMYMVNIESLQTIHNQENTIDELENWLYMQPHINDSIFEHIFNIPEGTQEKLERQFNSARFLYEEFQKELLDYGKIELGIDISLFDEDSIEFERAKLEIFNSLPAEMYNKNIELLANYRDSEKALLEQRKQNWMSLGNGIADIFNSIANIQSANIEREKENLIAQGKTEEEANSLLEDKFEQSKRFQIAASIIQTISGAIAAFMSCQELGYPWGTIIGAIQAASVTAAGIAQIKQIENTKMGSTTSVSSNYTSAKPRINDYQPDNVRNITSASDEQKLQDALTKTNIWVNVTDVTKAQEKGQVRVAESSF